MLPISTGGSSYPAGITNELALQRFVVDVAAALQPGDLVTLRAAGAGKTTFAR